MRLNLDLWHFPFERQGFIRKLLFLKCFRLSPFFQCRPNPPAAWSSHRITGSHRRRLCPTRCPLEPVIRVVQPARYRFSPVFSPLFVCSAGSVVHMEMGLCKHGANADIVFIALVVVSASFHSRLRCGVVDRKIARIAVAAASYMSLYLIRVWERAGKLRLISFRSCIV